MMNATEQTVFFVVECEPGYFLCADGQTSQVLDEAQVFCGLLAARKQTKSKPWRRIRKIKCLPGRATSAARQRDAKGGISAQSNRAIAT